MTKLELCKAIMLLIEHDTTSDPEELSDGAVLDMIYDIVSRQVQE